MTADMRAVSSFLLCLGCVDIVNVCKTNDDESRTSSHTEKTKVTVGIPSEVAHDFCRSDAFQRLTKKEIQEKLQQAAIALAIIDDQNRAQPDVDFKVSNIEEQQLDGEINFFTWVHDYVLEHATTKALLEVFEANDDNDHVKFETAQVNFFKEFRESDRLYQVLHNFMNSECYEHERTEDEFFKDIKRIWTSRVGTSTPFKNVFVGETQSDGLKLHNWLRVYDLENKERLKFNKYENADAVLSLREISFTLDGQKTGTGSIILGMNPATELALYTLIHTFRKRTETHFNLFLDDCTQVKVELILDQNGALSSIDLQHWYTTEKCPVEGIHK